MSLGRLSSAKAGVVFIGAVALLIWVPQRWFLEVALAMLACSGLGLFALKKYLDMNKLALGVVKPGGLLATFSCTGLVSEEQFLDMLRRSKPVPQEILPHYQAQTAYHDQAQPPVIENN